MKRCLKLLAALTVAVAAYAQGPAQLRRAWIGESKVTSGKCTIEVRVDIAAEVDILGDTGRLRTTAGQPATWTRMECSDPLPRRMTDFRFTGIDGRGNMRLFKDPRANNSVAVIHIEDPQGGSEGYTFDIEWDGGSGGAAVNGFGGPPPPPPPPPPASRGGGGFGQGRGAARISAERAMDLCRAEVHERGRRDYDLRDIDITSVGVDNGRGRTNWVTGAFTEGNFDPGRGSGYLFNCSVDYFSGEVGTIEILRADGSVLRPRGGPGRR